VGSKPGTLEIRVDRCALQAGDPGRLAGQNVSRACPGAAPFGGGRGRWFAGLREVVVAAMAVVMIDDSELALRQQAAPTIARRPCCWPGQSRSHLDGTNPCRLARTAV